MDCVIDEHAGKASDLEEIATVLHLVGQIVELDRAHLLEVDGDPPGARFGHDAVEGDDGDAGIAGLLDDAIQGIGRGGIDDDRIIALQDQVLDLGGLLRHLVFRGGEGIGCRDDAVGDRLFRHLVPAFQHGLPPGIAGIVVGERDLLVFGVGGSRHGRDKRGKRCGNKKSGLLHGLELLPLDLM